METFVQGAGLLLAPYALSWLGWAYWRLVLANSSLAGRPSSEPREASTAYSQEAFQAGSHPLPTAEEDDDANFGFCLLTPEQALGVVGHSCVLKGYSKIYISSMPFLGPAPPSGDGPWDAQPLPGSGPHDPHHDASTPSSGSVVSVDEWAAHMHARSRASRPHLGSPRTCASPSASPAGVLSPAHSALSMHSSCPGGEDAQQPRDLQDPFPCGRQPKACGSAEASPSASSRSDASGSGQAAGPGPATAATAPPSLTNLAAWRAHQHAPRAAAAAVPLARALPLPPILLPAASGAEGGEHGGDGCSDTVATSLDALPGAPPAIRYYLQQQAAMLHELQGQQQRQQAASSSDSDDWCQAGAQQRGTSLVRELVSAFERTRDSPGSHPRPPVLECHVVPSAFRVAAGGKARAAGKHWLP